MIWHILGGLYLVGGIGTTGYHLRNYRKGSTEPLTWQVYGWALALCLALWWWLWWMQWPELVFYWRQRKQ